MVDAVAASQLLQGAVALFTALAYGYVARLILRRRVEGQAAVANRAFAVWWISFGAVEFLAAGYQFPAAFGVRDLALAVTIINALLIMLVAALAGLVCFLVYLYTGSTRAFWPISIAYVALGAALLYLIAWMEPTGFNEDTGALIYARQLVGAPSLALSLLISLPVIVAALGYGSLYFRVAEREARYRILLVSGSFLAWFGWSAIVAALGLAKKFPLPTTIVNDVIALAAPLVIIAAYRPPRAVRAWLERG